MALAVAIRSKISIVRNFEDKSSVLGVDRRETMN